MRNTECQKVWQGWFTLADRKTRQPDAGKHRKSLYKYNQRTPSQTRVLGKHYNNARPMLNQCWTNAGPMLACHGQPSQHEASTQC